MERLISSPPLSSRAAPLRPHLLLRARSPSAPGKVALPPLPGSSFRRVLFAGLEGSSLHSPSCFSWPGRLTPILCAKDCPDETGSRDDSFRELGGRPASGLFCQRVVHAGALILFSAVILALIQPLLTPAAYAAVQSAAKASVGVVRTELLGSAWTGFLTGCLHTLSGPDHLAALAPLSIGRTRMESAVVGALWGCGHDAGQMLFGLIFLLLKDRLHIEIIRTWGTRVVGLTLLVIGAMGIREATEVPAPCVALENGECDVSMLEPAEALPSGKKKIGLATFATGIIHGLQPDALMMILPALALPSRLAGAAFLTMFLAGTVFAMGSYTVFIGSCSQALKERIPRITEKLTWASSMIAIFMGFGILLSQFFGFSLY